MNPRDINVMLIGYEGGVVAWDIQKGVVAKTFEMALPPGKPSLVGSPLSRFRRSRRRILPGCRWCKFPNTPFLTS